MVHILLYGSFYVFVLSRRGSSIHGFPDDGRGFCFQVYIGGTVLKIPVIGVAVFGGLTQGFANLLIKVVGPVNEGVVGGVGVSDTAPALEGVVVGDEQVTGE